MLERSLSVKVCSNKEVYGLTRVGILGLAVSRAVITLLCLLIFGCTAKKNVSEVQAPQSSIYHWKSTADVSTDWYTLYRPHRLYVKYLDLASRKGMSVKVTKVKSLPPANIVPVVFIDYQLLTKFKAEIILRHIERSVPPGVFEEIQIDCDWTLSTKDAYFGLLRQLSKRYPTISATIRLHQVKYFKKTGVPPVSRGVLMYYNMSKVGDFNTRNYILDLEVAKQYHVNFDAYPIQLDLALPIYRQARVFRDETLVGLIDAGALDVTALRDEPSKNGSIKTVTRGHYSGGKFLYEGDQLKVDTVSMEDLLQAAKGLKSIMKPKEIIYFEQGSTRHFTPQELSKITRIFGE